MTAKKTDSVVEMHAFEGADAPELSVVVAESTPISKQALEAAGFEVPDSMLIAAKHPLDNAEPGSKIVVVLLENKRKAVLSGPSGVTVLDADDPASKLPEGARICKVQTNKRNPPQYVATQLSEAVTYPDLVTATASEAIAQFVPYFHRTD